jgi:hypothetical protein
VSIGGHGSRPRDPVQRFELVPYVLFALFLAMSTALGPAPARADGQTSVRAALELGQRRHDENRAFIVGATVRGDVMFGAPKPRAFRIGPALELRTMAFETLEGAIGAGILIPMPGDAPIGLTGLIGSAIRKGDLPDGLVGIGTMTWGFRGYNYDGWYGYALNLFFSGRKHLGDERLVELTAGLEIDLMFLAVIPARAIVTFVKGGDPFPD